MQKQSIRLNRFYSASTEVIDSNLSLIGNYYVNSQTGLGGGVVSEFNVREFLENDKNESITRDFFSFLTANTTTSEFIEIYYSDKKLSSSFNDFYNSSVLSGLRTSPTVIVDELIQTSGITYRNNNLLWTNNNAFSPRKFLNNIPLDVIGQARINTPITSLTTYTSQQSYYIPIFVHRNTFTTPRDKFEICKDSNKIIGFIASSTTLESIPFEQGDSNLRETENIEFSGFTSNLLTPSGENPNIQPTGFILTGVVHSTIQCFVDLNLHLDSNEYWNNIKPTNASPPAPLTGLTDVGNIETNLTDTGNQNLRYGFVENSETQSPPTGPNPGNLINTRPPDENNSRNTGQNNTSLS